LVDIRFPWTAKKDAGNGRRDLAVAFATGLQDLVMTAFPKHCHQCGRVYPSAESFPTYSRDGASPPAPTATDPIEGIPEVQLFRRCPCGGPLADSFTDNRDIGEAGQSRRERFGMLIGQLTALDVDPIVARDELLKLMRGENTVLPAQVGIAVAQQ